MCELVRFQRLVSRLTEIVRTMQRFSHIFQQDSKESRVGWISWMAGAPNVSAQTIDNLDLTTHLRKIS